MWKHIGVKQENKTVTINRQKMPQKAYGAYTSVMIKKLNNSGLTGANLAMAIAALKSNVIGGAEKPVIIPRKVKKLAEAAFMRDSKIVISRTRKGSFKVYTLTGYQNMAKATSETATKHKPWQHSAKARSARAQARRTLETAMTEATAELPLEA